MKTSCVKCERRIRRRNVTGLCLACFNSDRQRIEKKRANIAAAKRRKLASDPAFAASQREHGRWLSRNFSAKANASISPETRAMVGRKYTQLRLGWCPPDRRDEYRRMVKNRGLTAAEAKAAILASLSPFERQLAKVRGGAGIIEIRPLPTTEPSHSLTGSSMAMVADG